jgi:hypothetical protein
MKELYLKQIAFYKNELMNKNLTGFMRKYYLTLLRDRYVLLEKLEKEELV